MAEYSQQRPAPRGSPFIGRVITHFQYLVDDFGFEVADWGVYPVLETVTFKNATTAVIVSWEKLEDYLEVLLSWLKSGARPNYDDTTHNAVLETLLRVRAPHVTVRYRGLCAEDQQDEVLAQQAWALREYGSDILRGDFSEFSKLKPKAKSS